MREPSGGAGINLAREIQAGFVSDSQHLANNGKDLRMHASDGANRAANQRFSQGAFSGSAVPMRGDFHDLLAGCGISVDEKSAVAFVFNDAKAREVIIGGGSIHFDRLICGNGSIDSKRLLFNETIPTHNPNAQRNTYLQRFKFQSLVPLACLNAGSLGFSLALTNSIPATLCAQQCSRIRGLFAF